MCRTYFCYRTAGLWVSQLRNHHKYLETQLLWKLLLGLWKFPSVSYLLVSLCCCACTEAGGSHCTSAFQLIHFETMSSVFLDNFIERFAEPFFLPFFFSTGSLYTSYNLWRRKLRNGAVTFSNALVSEISKACNVQGVFLQIVPQSCFQDRKKTISEKDDQEERWGRESKKNIT